MSEPRETRMRFDGGKTIRTVYGFARQTVHSNKNSLDAEIAQYILARVAMRKKKTKSP
jgi:hypothetical protein